MLLLQARPSAQHMRPQQLRKEVWNAGTPPTWTGRPLLAKVGKSSVSGQLLQKEPAVGPVPGRCRSGMIAVRGKGASAAPF